MGATQGCALVLFCWALKTCARQGVLCGAAADRVCAPPPHDPRRCTSEIRRIWVGYWSQADAQLGQRIAAGLQQAGAL